MLAYLDKVVFKNSCDTEGKKKQKKGEANIRLQFQFKENE